MSKTVPYRPKLRPDTKTMGAWSVLDRWQETLTRKPNTIDLEDRVFLRVQTIADLLDVNRTTVYRASREGLLPPLVQLSPRLSGLWAADLLTWAAATRDKLAAEPKA